MPLHRLPLPILAAFLLSPPAAHAQRPLPIIDMHLHAVAGGSDWTLCVPWISQVPSRTADQTWAEAWTAVMQRPPCRDPIRSPAGDDGVMKETIAVMERRNIVGVLSGPPDRVRRWHAAAPKRFIPSVQLQIGRDSVSPDSMRRLFTAGPFALLGEVSNQYVGIAPDDERMRPYWALAEELDVPVAIHMGEGLPGATFVVAPGYRARLSSPYLLEDVLIRHPRLRISVMHYGSPLIDEMIAMLGAYPQIYVDLGGIQWLYPRPYFYGQLRQLVEAGFGKRIMFGSDQVDWPGVIEEAIAIVEEAPFLDAAQKRDILYHNAARFLRLSEREIARHHGKAP